MFEWKNFGFLFQSIIQKNIENFSGLVLNFDVYEIASSYMIQNEKEKGCKDHDENNLQFRKAPFGPLC